MVVSGQPQSHFRPRTPDRLQYARTCYDHMAGSLAVALHDHLVDVGWLRLPSEADNDYTLTDEGERALANWGLDIDAARQRRRRFACSCMDWSMRHPHLAGALGAALLDLARRKAWVRQDLDSRALTLTPQGHKALHARLGADWESPATSESGRGSPARVV